MSRFCRHTVLTLCLLGLCSVCAAHAPGLSSTVIDLDPGAATINLTLAPQDIEGLVALDLDRDAQISAAEWNESRPNIARVVSEHVTLRVDGQIVKILSPATVRYNNSNNVHIALRFRLPVQHQQITYESGLLAQLPEGHREAVSINGEGKRILDNVVLTRADSRVGVTPAGHSTAQSVGHAPESGFRTAHRGLFNSFLSMGIEHIVTGYDHLLFLAGLLLVSQRLLDYVRVITFFTLAHSLTLALATLQIVTLSPVLVEPLIAASIAYVGLENLLRGSKIGKRTLPVFCFGLIHGLGFAGALAEAGIAEPGESVLLPLVGFNLGVELGQISVFALSLPLLHWLHGDSRTNREPLISAASAVVMLAGFYWLLDRTTGWSFAAQLIAGR